MKLNVHLNDIFRINGTNQYNCDVDYYHEFAPLFECDLVEDCYGGRDERGCEFDNKEVCPKGVSLPDDQETKCYR